MSLASIADDRLGRYRMNREEFMALESPEKAEELNVFIESGMSQKEAMAQIGVDLKDLMAAQVFFSKSEGKFIAKATISEDTESPENRGRNTDMNTAIANTVAAANDKAQYDEYAKRLIAQKIILAHILAKTVDEFRDMKPEDIVAHIEGDPKVGIVPVDPGMTNINYNASSVDQLIGLNTENSEINEGMIRFDIIFYVRMKDGLAQVIINIEIQKDDPTQYFLLNRAIFYVSRMVSSQKGRDFVHQNYNDMKRVFSIWLCMNMPSNSMSYVHLTKEDILEHYNWNGHLDLLNIVLLGIGRELPPQEEQYELHRLIGTLLSAELTVTQKLAIIETEYHIPLSVELEEGVNDMCNLGEGIEERAIEKTKKEVILDMYQNGCNLELIATVTKKNISEIEEIINNSIVSLH